MASTVLVARDAGLLPAVVAMPLQEWSKFHLLRRRGHFCVVDVGTAG